jgi:hypothetical protein
VGWRHYHCSPLAMYEHDVGLEAKLLGQADRLAPLRKKQKRKVFCTTFLAVNRRIETLKVASNC